MSDRATLVCATIIAGLFIGLLVIMADSNNVSQISYCVVNTSKQNLTADEISKLCGVGK